MSAVCGKLMTTFTDMDVDTIQQIAARLLRGDLDAMFPAVHELKSGLANYTWDEDPATNMMEQAIWDSILENDESGKISDLLAVFSEMERAIADSIAEDLVADLQLDINRKLEGSYEDDCEGDPIYDMIMGDDDDE